MQYSDEMLDSVVKCKFFVKDADREVCMLSTGKKCCDVSLKKTFTWMKVFSPTIVSLGMD